MTGQFINRCQTGIKRRIGCQNGRSVITRIFMQLRTDNLKRPLGRKVKETARERRHAKIGIARCNRNRDGLGRLKDRNLGIKALVGKVTLFLGNK